MARYLTKVDVVEGYLTSIFLRSLLSCISLILPSIRLLENRVSIVTQDSGKQALHFLLNELQSTFHSALRFRRILLQKHGADQLVDLRIIVDVFELLEKIVSTVRRMLHLWGETCFLNAHVLLLLGFELLSGSNKTTQL